MPESKTPHRMMLDSIRDSRRQRLDALAQRMGLSAMDREVDSFEMRLWVRSNLEEQDLVLLKYSGTGWKAQKTRFQLMEKDSIQYENLNVDQQRIHLPALADSLLNMRLDSLMSQEDIPGFVDNMADGVTYDLEIATRGRYRLITYHCPERFAAKEANNRKFLDLIMLVDRYFHFWSPRCGG